jgi:hypothetical protein
MNIPILPPQPEIDEASHVVQIAPTSGDSFSPHDFVKLAGGELVPSASADPSVFGLSLSEYPDPSGKLNQSVIPVLRARAGQRLWMNVSGAVLAQTHLGAQFGLVITNGVAMVDLTNTTEKVFEIIEIGVQAGVLPNGGIGDANARVLVEILSSAVA